MARIREALRQADLVRDRPVATTPFPGSAPPAQAAALSAVAEEIPFIEVGGGTPFEASPSVLAAAPAPRRARLPVPEEPKQAAASTPVPEREPAGVVFQTLPPEGPLLPPVPDRFAPELVAFHQPDQPAAGQYRALVANLETQLAAGQAHVLLFTAPTCATDTATVLLNLGITRARQGRGPVAVVDANLRHAAVAERLGLPPDPGLRDVLAGKVSLQRAVRETGQTGLHVLTVGKGVEDGPGLLAGEAMRAVLRHLRLRFEWVLVAAPHWDGRPDLVALASGCDAVYLVLAHAEAESAAMRDLLQILPQQGVCLRGCVYTGP